MPSRRPHTNSHHGCMQCKAMRVKCDQTQPRCSRCNKKNQECTYRHLMSSYDPFKHYNSAASGTNKRPQPPYRSTSQPRMPTSFIWLTEEKPGSGPTPSYRWVPPQQPVATSLTWPAEEKTGPGTTSSSCWMMPQYPPAQPPMVPAPELPNPEPSTHQLVCHYATNLSTSYLTSSSRVETLSVYQEAVNRHYLGNSCVYQALLTFSALHLGSLTPQPYGGVLHPSDTSSSSASSPYLVAALSHKAWALGQFRGILESVTAETCEPALAASALLTASTFGLPLAGAACDTVDLLWQIMSLYQCTTTIFRMGGWYEDDGGGDDDDDDWVSRRARSVSATTTATMSSGPDDSGSDLDFEGGSFEGYGMPSCSSPSLRPSRRRVRRGSETSWPDAEAAVNSVLAAIAVLPEDDDAITTTTSHHHTYNDEAAPTADDNMSVSSQTGSRRAVLAVAAAQLRTSLRRMAAARGLYGPAVEWLGMVPAGFVARVQAGDPLALVLLATWAAGGLAYVPGHVWWLRGWPARTLAAAVRALGRGGDEARMYAPLLRWAAAEVQRQGGGPPPEGLWMA